MAEKPKAGTAPASPPATCEAVAVAWGPAGARAAAGAPHTAQVQAQG